MPDLSQALNLGQAHLIQDDAKLSKMILKVDD